MDDVIEADCTYQGKGSYWELVAFIKTNLEKKKKENYPLPRLKENINVISQENAIYIVQCQTFR